MRERLHWRNVVRDVHLESYHLPFINPSNCSLKTDNNPPVHVTNVVAVYHVTCHDVVT